jgi:radical SAM PhpK family P-methyltransferase
MATIDCVLIGHNELSIAKSKRMLLYLYGKGSHEYRDRIKYNLSQAAIGDKRYSPTEIYNLAGRGGSENLSIITESFNLAIAYLGSKLHRSGLSFDFVNAFQEEKERLKQMLLENEVRSIAIITTYYLSHYPIHDIITFVRRHDRDVKIIVGGPYVLSKLNALADDERTVGLLDTIGADYYVKDSFGEDILVDLVRCIKAGEEPDGVANVVYRRKGMFRISRQEVRPYDFTENPVDWSLFKGRLASVINVRTAVSCPFKCAFCNFPSYAGKYTLAPIDSCERELRALRDQGVRYVQFVDDTFNVPRSRFKDLLRMLIRNDFGFRWNSYFKCQYVDREAMELMKESGCEFVFLGIESGSQTILDNMRKESDVDTYRRCIEIFNELGIMTMCSVIVGFPGETRATFEETFSFLEETRPTFYQQRLFWYDRTAPVHRERDRFQITGEGYSFRHATMCADEAHDLADELFLGVQGPIHVTEYVLPFFLLERGLSRQNAQSFLRYYMYANREQYQHPGVETDHAYIEGMFRALGQTTPRFEAT